MRKLHWLVLVDAVLGVAALGLLATGFLIEFVLAPRSRGATVWGLTRHDWGGIHFWLAVAMLAAGALHLGLHWQWVCSVTVKLCGGKPGQPLPRTRIVAAIASVAIVVTLVVGFLIAAELSKTVGVRGPSW